MRLGVPSETRAGERRVAVTPETARKLQGLGFEVLVEGGAGVAASLFDDAYREAGAEVVDRQAAWGAPLVVKVEPPTTEEVALLAEGATLVSFQWPQDNPESWRALQERGISALALESVPRIARAQRMDVLSSMANLAGYRAVVEAAWRFGRFFPMLMTAAGTVPPAHALVIGAGVAGLSAIATARRLGAVVRAFDTRPAVRDQVKSLGARFLEMELDASAEDARGYAAALSKDFHDKEMALLAQHVREVDIVITTALIGGREAPTLITAAMVQEMRPGSVIVDLAAPRGGNCELTVPGEAVEAHGVHILGYTDLASRMAMDASRLYARNLHQLLAHLRGKERGETLPLDREDAIVQGVLLLDAGEPTDERGRI